MLDQKVNFSGKTAATSWHRHVLGHASALRTPHGCHPRPRSGRNAPPDPGPGGSAAGEPVPKSHRPRPALLPPPLSAAQRRLPSDARGSSPAASVPRSPRPRFKRPAAPSGRWRGGGRPPHPPVCSEGAAGAEHAPAPGPARGRQKGDPLTWPVPRGGVSPLERLDPAAAIAAAASQGGAGLIAGTSRRSQARWVWKPVTTCQDGVAPNPPPPRERGKGLSELGKPGPRAEQRAAPSQGRGGVPRPGPARPARRAARQPRGAAVPRGGGWPRTLTSAAPRGAPGIGVCVGDEAQCRRWLGEKIKPSASSHGFQVNSRGASHGRGAIPL